MGRYRTPNERRKLAIPEAEEVDEMHRDLARALVSEDWDDADIPAVMAKYRRLSRTRRSGPAGTGAYLDVRRDEGRSPKIVVRFEEDGRQRSESTKLDAVEGQVPEDDPEAMLYFIGFEKRAFVKARARKNPAAFAINWLAAEWLEAHRPTKGVPDYKRKQDTFLGYQNACDQAAEWFTGKRLGDWHSEILVEYYNWRMQQPLRKGERDPEDLRDSPAIAQTRIVLRALTWAMGRFNFVYNIDCRLPEPTQVEREWLSFDEIIRLLWACLGYVWENGGWKTTTVQIGGVTKTVPYRLPKKERQRTQWMYRVFVLVFLTGTRYRTARAIHWYRLDKSGCIDTGEGVIWRNGRKAPVYDNKPKGRSDLFEHAQTIFKRWLLWDIRFADKTGAPLRYVIRNSVGGRLRNVDDMLVTIFKRAGIPSSVHKLKHAGVTLHAIAGFTLDEIAEKFCNDVETLRQHYEHVDWDKNERLAIHGGRPKIVKFSDLDRSPPTDEVSLRRKVAA